MQSHAHASTHAQNIRDVQKKARIVLFKKLQGVRRIARLKQQRFLSFTFYITQRSCEKIICIFYFIGVVVKIALYFHFLYIKKKKHEWWNNHFSDVFIVLTWKILLFSFWYKIISAYWKTETQDPSRTLEGPYKNLKTGTLADPSGPYMNPTCCKNVLHKQHGQLGFHFLILF